MAGILHEALGQGAQQAGEMLAGKLAENAPQMLEEHRAMWDDVRREVRSVWGEALDAFYELVVAVDETAGGFVGDNLKQAADSDNIRFKVLVDLMGQACRTAMEIWTLLANGMPAGAAARSRSMHEINVVTRVLAQNGDDVAQRYLDFEDVQQLHYVEEHDEHAGLTERDKYGPDAIEALRAAVADHRAEYGPQFTRPYGWALHLLEGGEGGFRGLEKMAGLDHWRADYRISSQSIHPTAWSATLNMEEGAIVTSWRLTGLSEPANICLVALHQVAATVLLRTFPQGSNILDQMVVKTLEVMLDRAQLVFVEAEDAAAERLDEGPVHPPPRDAPT